MITKVYIIYDSEAEESSQSLFFAKNDNVARRLFQNAVSSHLCKIKGVHLAAFKLVYVGDFNTETCEIVPFDGLFNDSIIQSANEVEIYEVEDEGSPVVASPMPSRAE